MRKGRLRCYLLAALLLAGLGAAPRSSAPALAAGTRAGRQLPARPNVLFIVADALRADHLSAYGNPHATTPNLDALVAQRGARFTDASSAASWTCPANGALVTGRSASSLGISWHSWENALPADANTLAESLRGAGYATAGFVTNGYVGARAGFAQGFDHYDDSLTSYPHSASLATALTDRVITWTELYSATQPLFLYVYYLDPHTWYNPPPPYDIRYDPTYTGTVTPEVYGDARSVVSGTLQLTLRDVEHVRALYDGEIAYTDEQIGRLFAYLNTRGLLDGTLVVVTSDHGDMFGEHNKWVHGNSLYEELLRVPLLLRYTGVISAGLVISAPVQAMDLMPTVLDYASIAIPSGLQAADLRPLIDGVPALPHAVFSEVDATHDAAHWAYWIAPSVDLRSMRDGAWKYIFHVTDPASDELYYLQPGSPYETENLLHSEPNRAAQMQETLRRHFSLHRAYIPHLVDLRP